MEHRVRTSRHGRYAASFTAYGVLNVTPVNPLTGEATGTAYSALVSERHHSSISRGEDEAEHVILQILHSEPQQSLFEDLAAGEVDRFKQRVHCGSQP
jgi:hypothetical protein